MPACCWPADWRVRLFCRPVAKGGVICGTKGGERPFSIEPGATADEATVKVENLSGWEVATLFFAADGR